MTCVIVVPLLIIEGGLLLVLLQICFMYRVAFSYLRGIYKRENMEKEEIVFCIYLTATIDHLFEIVFSSSAKR